MERKECRTKWVKSVFSQLCPLCHKRDEPFCRQTERPPRARQKPLMHCCTALAASLANLSGLERRRYHFSDQSTVGIPQARKHLAGLLFDKLLELDTSRYITINHDTLTCHANPQRQRC